MSATQAIEIITHSATVERLLAPLRAMLGEDYEPYRGHIYRVLTYSLYFLGRDHQHRQAVETALVYHDIGMWSDKELAYLQPSIERVLEANARDGWGLDGSLMSAIIRYHHKVFPYRGPHAETVNAVRRADWIDATGGKVRMGVPRTEIARVLAAIPEQGFLAILMRQADDLGGHRFAGLSRVLLNVYTW
ncbi:MAG: phosphohydrolase [Geminicoccaceae bacterium]